MKKTSALNDCVKTSVSTLLALLLIVAQIPSGVLTVHAQGQSTTILDTFNRANGAIGTNWSGATSGYSIASNRLDVGSGGTIFWGTQFGSEQEIFVTLTTIDANGPEQNLLLKSQSNTSTSSGVIDVWYDAINRRVQVWTYSSAQGWVKRGTNISVTLVNGDQFGARAKTNGMVEVYRNGTLIGTRDASSWTYSANGGYIGLWFDSSGNTVLDDFGGGNAVAGATSTPTRTPTGSPTATRTPTPSSTVTTTPILSPTPSRTNTPSLTPSQIVTATPSPTGTMSRTPTITSTNTLTLTPTYTPTRTATSTITSLPSGGFPAAAILDTFNRANGAIGTNWSGATSGYSIVSNRLGVGSGEKIYWGTQFGSEQEIFVTLTTIDSNGPEQNLLLKSQSNTSTSSGVIDVWYNATNSLVQVWTYSSAQGWVKRGTNISVTFANGDQFGARARANGMVDVYRNGTLIGSRDASSWTYSANGGYIGLWFDSSGNTVLDDFGGGSLIGGVTSTPTRTPTTTQTSPSLTPTNTPTRTATPVLTNTATRTPTSTSTPVFTATRTPTRTPTGIATNTSTPGSTSTTFFPVGSGGSDVIPHQVVRTNADFLYIIASQQSSTVLRVYRTTAPGLPNDASAFAAPVQLIETSNIISVDAVYDGGTIIHTIVNLQNGQVKDYPFDTSTNTFNTPITLASNGGTIGSVLYVGTSGVAGMVDLSGNLQVTYWTNDNHILHRAYTYNSATNTLTPAGAFFQVDTAGNANHPSVAVSPVDNSLTVAWVSQADNPTRIRTRTRASDGTWSSVESASTASVWTSAANGLNIDQGPSMLIDSAGTKHLVYIESFNAAFGDYGRIHYVTNTGSGWVDTALNVFSHDPALALTTAGNLYIIGHGHPENTAGSPQCISSFSSMDNMCTIQKNLDGTWGNPTVFAVPPNGTSFDASPSVKWSVAGFNRPDVIEFIFFRTPYDTPTLYYGRIP